MTPSRFEEDPRREGVVRIRAELELCVDTHAVREALAGREGVGESADYRGAPSLGACSPIETLGLDWALVAEMEAAEALAEDTTLRSTLLVSCAVAAAATAAEALRYQARADVQGRAAPKAAAPSPVTSGTAGKGKGRG